MYLFGIVMFTLVVVSLLMLLGMVVSAWWYPCVLNHKTSRRTDSRVNRFLETLEKGKYTISGDTHRSTITKDNGDYLQFWCANKFYAFADDGCISKSGEDTFYWSGSPPFRKTQWKMYKLIEDEEC